MCPDTSFIQRLNPPAGLNRPSRQHPGGGRLPDDTLPNAPGAAGANPAAGDGGQRGLQEPAVAVRADTARGRGLRYVQRVSSVGHTAQ